MTKSLFVRACLLLLACGLAGRAPPRTPTSSRPGPTSTPAYQRSFSSSTTRQLVAKRQMASGTQGAAEMPAINVVGGGPEQPVNIGLMMFTTKTNTSNNAGPHGAYVRFAARSMQVSIFHPLRQRRIAGPGHPDGWQRRLQRREGGEYPGHHRQRDVRGLAVHHRTQQLGRHGQVGRLHQHQYGQRGQPVFPTYRSTRPGDWAYVSGARQRQVQPTAAERLRQHVHRVHRQQPAGRWDGRLPDPPAQPILRSPRCRLQLLALQRADTTRAPGRDSCATGRTWAPAALPLRTAWLSRTRSMRTVTSRTPISAHVGRTWHARAVASPTGRQRERMQAALNTIVTKILAVNSVFAAVALPVSVNQRGSYLNQVYLGVFRPDAERARTGSAT